jgi:hypothetical protein
MTLKRRRTTRLRQWAARWADIVILDRDSLLQRPNVASVSIGLKERRRKVTGRICVKIYVRTKPPKRRIPVAERLPATTRVLLPIGRGLYKMKRVPTDVVWYVTPQFCAAPNDVLNPLAGGAELGLALTNIGSYACMVADAQGQRFALTAGHVISGARQGAVQVNLNVRQPLSGAATPAQAFLGRTAGGFFGATVEGFLDFALIRLDQHRSGQSIALDGVQHSAAVLSETAVVGQQTNATKFGAATLRTHGVFSRPVPSESIDGVTVTKVYEFKGAPGAPFGGRGDSGSLVVSTDPTTRGAIIGVLFAAMPPTPDAPGGRGFVFPFGRIRMRPA